MQTQRQKREENKMRITFVYFRINSYQNNFTVSYYFCIFAAQFVLFNFVKDGKSSL